MAKADLSAARLRELLHYDPETGVFTRIVDVLSGRWGTNISARKGEVAGTRAADGRVYISIDGTAYRAHRLAWLYMTGGWPKDDVDHWDTDPSNNRWKNLRDVTGGVNSENRRRASSHNKSSGILGVYKEGNRWRARLQAGGKKYSLGIFDTPEEAHQAYVAGKRELHAGCTL